MKKKPQRAFAAVDATNHIMVWTIKPQANQVREEVGKQWNEDCPAAGWIEARDKYNYRVCRVSISFQ